ncbi:MAG: alanine--tRNA ligase, partial [Cyclobacteriaceae bacterium]|nr:alanine--tRNA ligase [Cyclobacteriaceae bacterium]
MDSKIIREKFFNFFKDKKHAIVPSAPIVVKNDPTLMFTNAGMNQFKDYFLGNRAAESKRVADTQKCLRVSGKHNDLEEVGHDTYHHTMFEMLGNWSFGDYFKKEAIAWAWELLTEVYQLPKDRLYASVFGGDKGDQLAVDEEAFGYWSEIIPEDRILHGSKKDNFWEMGDTGPCGPCSEIHIDLRPEADRKKLDGKELVNQDHPLVVEIWNLVFMEYNRKEDGSLVNLPETHIDTGMGFERLCMAVQGKTSNYDTDVFTPLIEAIANLSGLKYGEDEKKDIAFRVISDHIRAVSFAIADGQLPSNTGAGYVIRRILRRAVRYGFTFLNFSKPTLFQLVDVLVHQFEGVFDELKAQQEMVSKVIEEEENSFLHTLENGLKKMEVIDQELQTSGKRHIDGKVAFELYDTYGFPFDLTSLIAREKGLTVDEAG